MKVASFAAFSVGALALVGLAVFELAGPPADPEDFGIENEDPRDRPAKVEELLPGGVSVDMRGHTPRRRGVAPVLSASHGVAGNKYVTAKEARESFGNALAEMDQILADRRRLTPTEYDKIYRWANDAYTGYSIHLDGKDREDRDALEDAREQLLQRIGKLSRRVKKRRRGRKKEPPPQP